MNTPVQWKLLHENQFPVDDDSFECDEGEFHAVLDEKAWGKKKAGIHIFLSLEET